MLYLETPIGVGFSNSRHSSNYVAVDDEATGTSVTRILSFSFLLLSTFLLLFLALGFENTKNSDR